MAFPIEILTTDQELVSQLVTAIQSLNYVQTEFRFEIANARLLNNAFNFHQQSYTNEQIYEWLTKYRVESGGLRPYIILVITKPLSGARYSNLYGGHRAVEGLAWFTMDSFDDRFKQFLFDKIRFARYYFVRYTLSFVNPIIKAHDTKGCMFDNKIAKRDIRLSYDTGKICDDCLRTLRFSPLNNVDVGNAIDKLLAVVSNQFPRALVMKGGGVKGLALIGALKELEKYFTFDTFAGTSAGAIAATLLGAGYTPNELEQILSEKNFNDFKNGFLKQFWNFITRLGLNDGKHFREWMETLLRKKLRGQVSEIKMKDLKKRAILYATSVGEGLLRFDSNGERKETTAAFATRCSMSIPLIFKAEKIEGVKVYDGGLGNNFPLRTFISDNGSTLFIGLYLTSDVKKKGNLYTDLRDIVTDADERQIVDANLDKIVIIDPRPIETTQFSLTDHEKKFLLQAGKVGALIYLYKYHGDMQISFNTIDAEERKLEKMRKKVMEPWLNDNELDKENYQHTSGL